MSRPIPKSLLIHSVTHTYNKVLDSWKKVTSSDTRTVKHVRLEPSTRRVINKENQQVQVRATMFYDCHNSTPRAITFADGDSIIFADVEYIVNHTELLFDDSKRPHHMELELV
jgi:hypothetical protein